MPWFCGPGLMFRGWFVVVMLVSGFPVISYLVCVWCGITAGWVAFRWWVGFSGLVG